MASLIAGHGHGDGEGVVGLAPGAKILPIFHGDGGSMPKGIKWAVDHGAKVINISEVTDTAERDSFTEAVAYALQHKVLIVAGAGNDGGPVLPPADVPGVLAVGAVDKNRKVWPQSNSGPQLMLTAPGVDVVMAGTGGPGSCTSQYCMADGTSDSTAYVSAAAALVFAKYPDLTPGQVANRLVKTAAAPAGVSQLPDSRYGYGVIRPYEALTADIPTGSAQGPLAAADDDTAATDSTGRAPADHRSPSAVQGIQQPSSGLSLPLIAGIGGGAPDRGDRRGGSGEQPEAQASPTTALLPTGPRPAAPHRPAGLAARAAAVRAAAGVSTAAGALPGRRSVAKEM
ncbi:S8 family serine peptidase [Kitasatospora cineracea]|uniref:Subtilase family protein n=1 Tax=Kitasatospora cineracea TaxID=88074 RepID=A0A3N4SDK3_9ACTN|nr:S8 family serine peptidase [Kitasatospora cineracea]RPE34524.1 subtilase family protein [Kitasatospora cineracea]